MKVVIDTNVLLISLPSKSKYRIIFDKIINGEIELFITNEIISEYFEILSEKTNPSIANNIIELLLNLENVSKSEVYFKWGLIQKDADDNKFVDCAICAGSDFLITNDKHFNVLKNIEFPKVTVLDIDSFLEVLSK